MRSDRRSVLNAKLRTNAERCAQCTSLLGIILIIATAVLIYFAVTSEFGEQKKVYYLISFINIIAFCLLIGLSVYFIRKFSHADKIKKAYEQKRKFDIERKLEDELKATALPLESVSSPNTSQVNFTQIQMDGYY
jgi:uncharacterized membrane protein